jgi:hypothetical protein
MPLRLKAFLAGVELIKLHFASIPCISVCSAYSCPGLLQGLKKGKEFSVIMLFCVIVCIRQLSYILSAVRHAAELDKGFVID